MNKTKMKSLLIRIAKATTYIIVVTLTLSLNGSKGVRCGAPYIGPQIPASGFVEWDKMQNTEGPYLWVYFLSELKEANPYRILHLYNDDENISDIEMLDASQTPDEVYSFLDNHRTIVDTVDTTLYVLRFYMCAVLGLKDPDGKIVGGLMYRAANDDIHGEGMFAVAHATIRDSCLEHEKVVWEHYGWCYAHEAGHLFNLDHCSNTSCMMGRNWSVSYDARKTFCSGCRSGIGQNIP